MLAPKIITHVEDALNRLLQQYRGRPRYEGFQSTFAKQIQELEDAIFALDSGQQIWDGTQTPSVGAQLDQIGEIVGINRNGLPDDEYILFLFGKIAENFSDTTVGTLAAVIGFLFQTSDVFIAEGFPAGIEFEVFGTPIPESLWPLASNIVLGAKGAGIKLLMSAASSDGQIFRFDGPGIDGNINGFGDSTDPSVGGKFIGRIN